MAFAYTIKDKGAIYFVTFTVHQWVDVFTRLLYRELLIESLQYCQQEKGLEIFAYVIMNNHIHLIVRAKNENLPDIIRDFKKFTAKKIYKAIQENSKESRKVWMLKTLTFQDKIWFWEEGYHGVEINSLDMYESKVNYIHNNLVRVEIVEKTEDYLLSSARDFLGLRNGKIELTFV